MKTLNRSNVASGDEMPAWTTVQKTIFIGHDAPAEPRFQRRPRVAAAEGATRTPRTGIKPTNAPAEWRVSVPVKPAMSDVPISENDALIVMINGVAADPWVARSVQRDLPYAPKQKTPPSVRVGVVARHNHRKARVPF